MSAQKNTLQKHILLIGAKHFKAQKKKTIEKHWGVRELMQQDSTHRHVSVSLAEYNTAYILKRLVGYN